MNLQFIDQSKPGIGSAERRLIRSHVMRGKNKGRPRPSWKSKKTTERSKSLWAADGTTLKPSYTIPRQVLWSDLCLTSFPQELDAESTALMHRCMLSTRTRALLLHV